MYTHQWCVYVHVHVYIHCSSDRISDNLKENFTSHLLIRHINMIMVHSRWFSTYNQIWIIMKHFISVSFYMKQIFIGWNQKTIVNEYK